MREEWLAAVRSYMGAPFLHQGRTMQGIDCIGLIMCASRDIGYRHDAFKINDYRRAPNNSLFEKYLAEYLEPVPCNRLLPIKQQAQVGDILAFWIDTQVLTRHVAVYSGLSAGGEPNMIHAYAKGPKCVCEQPISQSYWRPRLKSIWRLPNFKEP